MLSRLPARIYAIVLIATMALLAMSEIILSHMNETAYDMREQHLADLTDTAIDLLADLQTQVQEGALTLDAAQAVGRQRLNDLSYGSGGYFFVLNDQAVFEVHPTMPEWIGTDQRAYKDPFGVAIFQEMLTLVEKQTGGMVKYHFKKPGSDAPEAKVSYVKIYPEWRWIIGTGSYVSDIEASLAHARNNSLAALAVAVAVLLAVSTLLARSVTRPIGDLRQRMVALSTGDATAPIPHIAMRSEVGDMARAVEGFRLALIEKDELEVARRDREAEMQRIREDAAAHEAEALKREAEAEVERLREQEAHRRQAEALRAEVEAGREGRSWRSKTWWIPLRRALPPCRAAI